MYSIFFYVNVNVINGKKFLIIKINILCYGFIMNSYEFIRTTYRIIYFFNLNMKIKTKIKKKRIKKLKKLKKLKK